MKTLVQNIFSNGERFPMLIDEVGVPDFWVTLFTSQALRKQTQSSIISCLGNIKHLNKWERINDRDLIQDFQNSIVPDKRFVESFTEHCGLKSEYIDKELKQKSRRKVSSFDQLRLARSSALSQVSCNYQQRRMTDARAFLMFVGQAILKRKTNSKSLIAELWERFGIKDEDGSEISITSHQLRVWLNTHAMNGGMDDYLLAMWSGRADVTQNRAYDGRTESEKDRLKNKVMEIDHKSPPTALALFSDRLPVPLPSLGVNREGVADFTGIGFCVHNFAQTPCTKTGECITCKEHVCMKGLPDTLENLEQMELLIAEQLESAKAAATDLTFGADRWVTHLGWKFAHIRTIIENLKNPDVPNGSIIRIPVAHDPSPTRRALYAKGQTTELNSTVVDNNHIGLQMTLLGSLDA